MSLNDQMSLTKLEDTVENRFNEGRQKVLNDNFSAKKPKSCNKAFQRDQNDKTILISKVISVFLDSF